MKPFNKHLKIDVSKKTHENSEVIRKELTPSFPDKKRELRHSTSRLTEKSFKKSQTNPT